MTDKAKEGFERKWSQKLTGGGPAPPELLPLTRVIVEVIPQDFEKP